MIHLFIKRSLGPGIRPVLVLLFSVAVTGCYRPQESVIPQQDPGALYTIAAQTAAVHLTQAAFGKTPQPASQTPAPDVIGNFDLNTVTPDNSDIGEDTGPCDQIRFVKDVTVPDDQELRPGEQFTKTWRLQNAGTCTWTIGYVLVFEKGDVLGAPATFALTNQPVPPGETIDVTVQMTAPDEVGSYQGYWKIRNVKGDTFGLGEFNQPFWIKINVVEGGGMMFDFNVSASEAAWGSGTVPVNYENIGEKIVYFDQQKEPTDPAVKLDQDLPLEGGRSSGILLYMNPGKGKGNYILGRFPTYTVNNDDLLSGRVGLIENSEGNCGSGNVQFQIQIMQEDDPATLDTIWEGNEICDDQMQSFEVGLDAYTGKAVHFFLTVIANDNSGENKAVWDSLAVHR